MSKRSVVALNRAATTRERGCILFCRVEIVSAAGLLGPVAAAILLLVRVPARADVYWSNTASGAWSAASNWGGTVPTEVDTAYVVNGGTATITLAEACHGISLGGTGESGTIRMTAGTLNTANDDWSPFGHEYIGYSGTGTFTQSGGVHCLCNVYDGNLYLGYNAGMPGPTT